MAFFTEGIRRIRPAPLGAAIARASGLNRRRFVQTAHGTFFVNPLSILGSQLLSRAAEYDPATREVLRRYLKQGSVFVDLGANEGYFTVIASAMVGTAGKVICIEPQSRLQEVIEAHLQANSCANVQVKKVAVSSRTGKVHLELTSELNTGATSLFRHTKYHLPKEEVHSYTLAELFSSLRLGHCDLLKVDIEGAEYDAFVASRDFLLTGTVRTIAVEVHGMTLERRGLSWAPVDRLMRECGYRMESADNPRVYSLSK